MVCFVLKFYTPPAVPSAVLKSTVTGELAAELSVAVKATDSPSMTVYIAGLNCTVIAGGRERGREGGREGGRERESGWEREGGREREGERVGERGREREGGRERGRERKGERKCSASCFKYSRSLMMMLATVLAPSPAPTGEEMMALKDSCPSSKLSANAPTLKVALVSPAGKVTVCPEMAS